MVVLLLALFKIRNMLSEAGALHQSPLGHILDLVNSGKLHLASRPIRVSREVNA